MHNLPKESKRINQPTHAIDQPSTSSGMSAYANELTSPYTLVEVPSTSTSSRSAILLEVSESSQSEIENDPDSSETDQERTVSMDMLNESLTDIGCSPLKLHSKNPNTRTKYSKRN